LRRDAGLDLGVDAVAADELLLEGRILPQRLEVAIGRESVQRSYGNERDRGGHVLFELHVHHLG
jgi:hypothetical protein